LVEENDRKKEGRREDVYEEGEEEKDTEGE
jgi:hypothetical protein